MKKLLFSSKNEPGHGQGEPIPNLGQKNNKNYFLTKNDFDP
ncbi:MAG TPA: hypothetical protein VJ873_11475 [bacterium]|nr:hypothetical protein [bacterium]